MNLPPIPSTSSTANKELPWDPTRTQTQQICSFLSDLIPSPAFTLYTILQLNTNETGA